MTTDQPTVDALLAEMRAYAATLRGSEAKGAQKLLARFDPTAADPGQAPHDTHCAHGVEMFGAYCDECEEAKTTGSHRPEMRTFTNPKTYRRTTLCRVCRCYQSNYRHTGEIA
jgi:hypothetical protein